MWHIAGRRISVAVVVGSVLAAALIQAGSVPADAAAAGLPPGYDVQEITNPNQATIQFGDAIWNVGDQNGDDEEDFAVGIDEHGGMAGYVYVYSGTDGSLIRQLLPPDGGEATQSGGNPYGWGNSIARVPDIGSCTDASPVNGGNCASVGGPDGFDDLLIGARGADVAAAGDDLGAAFLVDPQSGAVLKKIVMPANDRVAGKSDFASNVLVPTGRVPCEGMMGVGDCPTLSTASDLGDLDGDGVPDFVISARGFNDRNSSYANADANNPRCASTCFQSGRVFVYSGADALDGDSAAALATPMWRIKNPYAQADNPDTESRFWREAFGYSMSPLGDVGRCNPATNPQPGDICLGNDAQNDVDPATPGTQFDGIPEFVVSVHRYDTFGMGDAGAAMVIDGASGAVIHFLEHPEPQPSAIFGYSRSNQPAIGNIGSSAHPDILLGAMVQNVQYRADGSAYVLTGDPTGGGANHFALSVMRDPTPAAIGNFGAVTMGVGNLSSTNGDLNEVMIGQAGPHAPKIIDDLISDVHIFDPTHGTVLQTIGSPSQQPGAGFGRAMAPLGDVNDDGFLDFVIGEGLYDGPGPVTDVGHLYIFRSSTGPQEVERSVTLDLRKHLVARGQVSANEVPSCEQGVSVAIKRNGEVVETATTDTEGAYKVRLPDRPGRYQAVAKPTGDGGPACLRAKSPVERHRH